MIGQYLKMIRLHIVAGGILAFTLGALLALVNSGSFNPLSFAVFYLMIFFGDLSTHFSNDYFDVNQDRLRTAKGVFSGSNILVSNPQMRRPARAVSLALLVTSIFIAVTAVASGFAPVEFLLVAFAVNFLGWFYSAPPLRLVSHGLGEVAIALAVGVGIPAAGYLSVMGHFDGLFGLLSLPFLLYGFMLAFSLEAADVEVDRLGDKKTVGSVKGAVAVFGMCFAVAFAALLLFVGYALLLGGWAVDFWVFAVFAVAPVAAAMVGIVGVHRRKRADGLCLVNVFSLFLINLLIVVYLCAVWFF
jgi:1,4-dihydroxy-2-naphthoate octaprenyltransferase